MLQWFFKRSLQRKVPEIIFLFWVIKLLTTALGESTSDYLVHTLDPVVAVGIGALGFSIAMVLQLWAKKYLPWTYWLAVTMVAIFGTMAADVVHIVLGVPYALSSIGFALVLAVVFVVWYKSQHTLSIHSISIPRREVFYWATVIATFALGTALGDMTAVTLNVGYLLSAVLFGILFIIPLLARKYFRVSEVLTFWAAYIVTRPLGASVADWLGRTPDLGGVGFGTGPTSLVLTLLILVLVGYLSITKKDTHST